MKIKNDIMRVTLFFALVVFLNTCNQNPNGFIIEGAFTNHKNDKIYLEELTTKARQPIDSVIVDKNGKFIFTREIKKAGFYMLSTASKRPNNNILLIANPSEKISVTADLQNMQKSYDLSGSPDSKLIWEANKKIEEAQQEIMNLENIYHQNKETTNRDSLVTELDNRFREIVENYKNEAIKLIKENESSLATLIILYQRITPKQYVFDPTKDIEYFNRVDSVLMSLYPDCSQVKELHRFISMQKTKNREQLSIGDMAPEIALPTPRGDTIALTSLRGKYVLLDFWAGWCKPCRLENPNLVKNYEQFSSKGFDIYQVSLDKSKDTWLSAIEQDKLSGWHQVSDLQYWNSVPARIYNVKGIPANFLLDKEGKIIAMNLRGKALTEKLTNIFK